MGLLTDFKIEVTKLSFVGSADSMIVTFTNNYHSPPTIVAIAQGSAAGHAPDINVFVENVTTTNASICISDPNYVGTVCVQIIGS